MAMKNDRDRWHRHWKTFLLMGMLGLLYLFYPYRASAELQVKFTAAKGLSLTLDGVSIINNSMLDVVSPDRKQDFFPQSSLANIQSSDNELTAQGENENYAAQLQINRLDANTIEYHFHGVLKKETPANIEIGCGLFNANILAGRSFRAVLQDGKTVSGTVPVWPEKNGLVPLINQFHSLEFDSRLGQLTLTVTSPGQFVFADARRRKLSWANVAPVFYAGISQNLQKGTPFDVSFQLQLNPKTPQHHSVQEVTVTPARGGMVFPPVTSERQIVPKPRHSEISSEKYFYITRQTPWNILLPPDDKRPLQATQDLFKNELGAELPEPQITLHDSRIYSISIGNAQKDIASSPESAWRKETEGYRLQVDSSGIKILSTSPQGLFDGVQTLAQLLTVKMDGAVQCPYAVIEDWPSLKFRGAQWFPSGNGFEMDKKLIRLMARFKMNAAVLEVDFAKFDSHPQNAVPGSIDTSQLKELVKLCRENYIEPIPLINCLGHAQWAFGNGANKDFEEWPGYTREIAANNPKTINYLKDIFNETIDIFHPKYFHIGHDEVSRGPNPENAFNTSTQTISEWLAQSVNRWDDWFGKKNIKLMMWGDMLLARNEANDYGHASSPAEAAQLRHLIPKDVIIADWHYHSATTYPSFSVLKQSGFSVLGCPWYDPGNVATMAHDAIQEQLMGTLQTTWCGFYPNENTLASNPYDFPAFIIAADYAWSGRQETPDALPYNIRQCWYQTYQIDRRLNNSLLLPLTVAAKTPADNWLDLGSSWTLSSFFSTDKTAVFNGVPFQLSPNRLVTLAPDGSPMAPPEALSSLQIQLNAKNVRQIVLLNAALWKISAGEKIAALILTYQDGSESVINLNSGGYVLPWWGEQYSIQAEDIFMDQNGNSAVTPQLSMARITNPYPEKTIVGIRLDANSQTTGYALGGITLLTSRCVGLGE
jgi:hypothetical protein